MKNYSNSGREGLTELVLHQDSDHIGVIELR